MLGWADIIVAVEYKLYVKNIIQKWGHIDNVRKEQVGK